MTKLDTSKDRLNTVMKLFVTARTVDDYFQRNRSRTSFGDLLGFIAMMEKLTALEDFIKTEIILEDSLCGMLNVENTEARKEFVSIFGSGVERFLKNILIERIDQMISFASNNFDSRRLMKFQTEYRETMMALRDRYKELYGI